MNQVIAEPMSTKNILFLTNTLRKKFNLYDCTYFPIVEFIETVLPEIDPKFSYLYVDKAEMPDTYEYFDNDTKVMVIREDVYERALNGSGRDRFTLAHELGHYVLHSSGVQLCRSDGGRVVTYGAPVLPGAMFLLSYNENGIPVCGLPGCVMYAKRTIFDIVLPYLLADEPVTAELLSGLGNGGLCLNCKVCHYPNCGFGKGA